MNERGFDREKVCGDGEERLRGGGGAANGFDRLWKTGREIKW